MPLEPPGDDEPTPEDLEFYYGLSRRSAENQDAPFANWSLAALLGALLIIPLLLVLVLTTANSFAGLFALLIVVVIILILPTVSILALVFGSLVFSSLIQLIRQIFKDSQS